MYSNQDRRHSINTWTAMSVVGIIVLLAIAVAVATLIYFSQREERAPQDDAGWVIFQLGFEHQRLQLAAETEASASEIRLRGDIYLSRVLLVRDAPMLESLRQSMLSGRLTELLQSSQITERLISSLESPGGREALIRHLRSEGKSVRELMLDMSNLNRQIQWETRKEHERTLLTYLAVLEALLLVMVGLSLVVLHITRRLRKAGRDLTRQFATQDAILRSVDAAILGLGPKGNVLYSNPRAVSLLGRSAASGAMLLADDKGEESLMGQVAALVAEKSPPGGGGSFGVRKVHVPSEHGTRHYEIRKLRTVHTHADEVDAEDTALIVTVADVTGEEEAALRRDEYDARIGEASRLLAFAAISGGIVHEISQPLAAIRNYIYALKVSLNLRSGSEEHRAIADRLGEEIDRAIEVVRNVRRMGPQEPQEHQDVSACEVHEAIAHSVRLVSLGSNPPPPITVKENGGRTVVAGSLPLIGQVIVNLLKNALSASQAAGRAGAEVIVISRNGCAEIAVGDFGSGVSADAAKTLFSPFSKSARGGMGLGLAICQRIASNLGGSLSWENREGMGAVFTFTVPLAEEGHSP